MRRRWILLSATGLVLAAAAIIAVHSFGAGSAVVCPRSTDPSWDPYDGTAAQATACGLTVFPLISVTAFPDGGRSYVYQEPAGSTSTENVPPPAFNALGASASERALYGIPPEPPAGNSIAHAHWLQEVGGAKSWVQPPPFLYSVPG